jgi:hypothetical protein
MGKGDSPRKRGELPSERKNSPMRMKIRVMNIFNQIQNRFRVKFKNNKLMTKVPCQRKASPNGWEFSKHIRCCTTWTKKTMNPNLIRVSQRPPKPTLIGLPKEEISTLNLK